MKKIQEFIAASKLATQGTWNFLNTPEDGDFYHYYEGRFVSTENNKHICDFGDKECYYPTSGNSPSGSDTTFITKASEARGEIETLYTLAQKMARIVERQKRQLGLAGYGQTSLSEDADKALIEWTEFVK